MFKISRKTMIIGAMILLLVITGYLNWRYTSAKNNTDDSQIESETGDDVTTGNFFTDFRTERQSNREAEITYLDSVINNENTDAATLADAQKMKLEIVDNMEKETTIEGLLRAKGFEDVAVTISTESVNVVVKDPQLTQSKVAQVLDVVKRESSCDAENIKIIPTT